MAVEANYQVVKKELLANWMMVLQPKFVRRRGSEMVT